MQTTACMKRSNYITLPIYSLPPWSGLLLKKLISCYPVRKFLAFYRTRQFVTSFARSRQFPVSWAMSVQVTHCRYISLRPILILSSHIPLCMWTGYRSLYSDWLRAGRSGDRIPVGGEIFRTCPGRPWGPPSLLYNGYRVFPGGKERPRRDANPSPPSIFVVMKE